MKATLAFNELIFVHWMKIHIMREGQEIMLTYRVVMAMSQIIFLSRIHRVFLSEY